MKGTQATVTSLQRGNQAFCLDLTNLYSYLFIYLPAKCHEALKEVQAVLFTK